MTATTEDVLAAAVASLVNHGDVTDSLQRFLRHCSELTGAAAIGVLVQARPDGPLEVLAATSHLADELEMYQLQQHQGPCLDVLGTNEPGITSGAEAIERSWGPVGPAIASAGFTAVHAFPMHWDGQIIGGLNIFYRDPEPSPDVRGGQTLADITTLIIMQASPAEVRDASGPLARALRGRIALEHAKGVLAQQLSTSPAEAFDTLLRRAHETGESLSELAASTIRSAGPRD